MNKADPKKRARYAMEFKVQPIRRWIDPGKPLDEPKLIAEFWREHVMPAATTRLDRMCVWVICLDVRRQLIGYELVAIGQLDTVNLHPREVLRAALAASAAAIVVVTCNPNSSPEPKPGVIKFAPELMRAVKLMRIELLDMVTTVSDARPFLKRDYCSLVELGFLKDRTARPSVRVKLPKITRLQLN